MDTFIHYGVAASIQAVRDAGLPTGDELTEEQAERIGCLVGSGIGGLPLIEETHGEYVARGPRRISPFFVPASIINMISGHVSIRFGFTGPNLASDRCTTGCIHGQADAASNTDDAEVMVAGGAESNLSVGIARHGAWARRPHDDTKDGFDPERTVTFCAGEGRRAGARRVQHAKNAARRSKPSSAVWHGADAFST